MQTTAERLRVIYPFSDNILDVVNNIAEEQANLSYSEFMSSHKVPDVQIYQPQHSKAVEILDITPKEYNGVVVLHESMGTSLDPNAVMHVVPLTLALPDKRIIAVGNPGRPSKGYGKVGAADLPGVWSGSLRSTVEPILEYLVHVGEEKVGHVGYSFGADKVQAAGQFSDKYDLKALYGVSMEPVSIRRRNLLTLAWAFNSTTKYMADSVNATDSSAYI